MMKKRNRNIVILIIAAALTALTLLFAGAWLFASKQLSKLDTHKEIILKTMGSALDRNVTYEKGQATLTLREGLSIQFTNLMIWEKDDATDLLRIETASFRVDFLPLLAKRVVLREAILHEPRLSLKRDQNGILNIADLLNREKKPEMSLDLKKVTIENGALIFIDQTAGVKGLKTSLTNLQCRIDPKRFGAASQFKIIATLNEQKNRGSLLLAGTFHPAPSGKPLKESTLNASIRLTGMDISHYRSYLRDDVSNQTPRSKLPRYARNVVISQQAAANQSASRSSGIEQLAGNLDMETTVSGTFARFTAKGSVKVKDALLAYPHVFQRSLRPRLLQADYVLTRNEGTLSLEVARLVIDRVAVAGRFVIRDMDKDDPLLEAAAATSTFSLTEMRSYVPWGIIPSSVGDFIQAHVTGGHFRLVEGRVSGRLSQITGMMKQENAGVLSIRAEVDKGIFVVGAGDKTPHFTDISGTLELKNRQFSVSKMTGRFGASPCGIDGFISDFALPGPVTYTAKMSLQPVRDEVVWLLGKNRFQKLAFDGPSTLLLSGQGPAEDFHISAIWDLTGAGYRYEHVVEKPAAKHNRFTAELILSKDAFKVSSFEYHLAPVSMKGSAVYRFTGKSPVSLDVSSNQFDVREAVSILPGFRKFEPSGLCRIRIAGRGDPDKPGEFLWKGDVSFANVAFKPAADVKPLHGLTGVAAFKGDRMETSVLQAQIGKSLIKGKCQMPNLRDAGLSCRLSIPHLQAADVGLYASDGDVSFQDVKTQFTAGADILYVNRFSFRMGKSIFIFSGDWPDLTARKITVNLNSPYIHSDDAFRLMALKTLKRADDSASTTDLDLSLHVDAGVFKGFDFRKLNAGLKYSQGVLKIENLDAGILDGSLKSKGIVELKSDGQNRYKMNFALDQASMEAFEELLDIGNRTLTGRVSVTGDVDASGSSMEDFIKTATGSFQLRAEKGVLKKFSVLAKIFSLLNVSQLLKFQLPDMVEDGMPYTSMTAGLSLKDGVLSSEDFLIRSNAMQISIVGNVDLAQKILNNIVGVHPLRTLDLIAAKIPIAGWVLTDEKGHLVTVHFEVKGTWDNPEVRPIPAKSLAKGTLDIFRRLFQLPEKLVTDTGDVILGR